MTDRVHSFQVILEKDLREDDAKPVLDAILQVKHVIDVIPITADVTTRMAEVRAQQDLCWKVLKIIKGDTQ